MNTKEIPSEVAQKLPPDATLGDAIHELEFRQAVEDGLAELDRGEGISIEEVRAKLPDWKEIDAPAAESDLFDRFCLSATARWACRIMKRKTVETVLGDGGLEAHR